MKYFIFTIILALANALPGMSNISPTCVSIRSKIYEQEILKQGLNKPYQLAIDYNTKTLFFSYTADSTDMFKIAYLNFETNNYGTVNGIRDGFATAVDVESHVVYMGGQDGLYTFNYDTRSATKINISPDVEVWQMFYKDRLYLTNFPNETAFFYNNQEIIRIPELKDRVMILAVKNDGSYLYSNSSGLFTYNKTTGVRLNIGDYTVNGITADMNGKIYFSTPNAIYYVDDQLNEIEKLVTLEDVYGVAIEGNGNIIYANEESVIRLKPATRDCEDENIVYLSKL